MAEIENNDDEQSIKAVENGNLSGASSAPTSKSSSQIKLKYQYPEGMKNLFCLFVWHNFSLTSNSFKLKLEIVKNHKFFSMNGVAFSRKKFS